MSDAPPILPILAILLVTIAILGIIDLVLDSPDTWLSVHVIVEVLFVSLCMGSALYLGVAWGRAERGLVRVRQVLAERQQERDAWREQAQTALRGLGEAIDNQLTAWSLTPAEKETALLLLKGYSHKEIAHHTDRSERTVRQHSVSVYRKSGLSGRAELAAFFLEDLLLPGDESGRTGATGVADA